MDRIRRPFWQTDTAVSNSSWGYTDNQNYKSVDQLVDDLVDIVAKNGCLLLNVGPRPDGTIPQEDAEILRGIGKWLKINGEAIYGSRPWKVYGEGPAATATGHLSEHLNKPFTAQDVRFTTNDGVLHAILRGWPDGACSFKSLARGNEHLSGGVAAVELFATGEPLPWRQSEEPLIVGLPDEAPGEHPHVLAIELAQE
mgnify:CR=1 FL=1